MRQRRARIGGAHDRHTGQRDDRRDDGIDVEILFSRRQRKEPDDREDPDPEQRPDREPASAPRARRSRSHSTAAGKKEERPRERVAEHDRQVNQRGDASTPTPRESLEVLAKDERLDCAHPCC